MNLDKGCMNLDNLVECFDCGFFYIYISGKVIHPSLLKKTKTITVWDAGVLLD